MGKTGEGKWAFVKRNAWRRQNEKGSGGKRLPLPGYLHSVLGVTRNSLTILANKTPLHQVEHNAQTQPDPVEA